jgi:hypothetical protein
LRDALEGAVEILEESCGPDPAGWSWGALHAAELRHPLGVVKPLRGLLNRGPYPLGGDANTVRLAAFRSEGAGKSGLPSFSPVTTGPQLQVRGGHGELESGVEYRLTRPVRTPGQRQLRRSVSSLATVRYRPMVFGRENRRTRRQTPACFGDRRG